MFKFEVAEKTNSVIIPRAYYIVYEIRNLTENLIVEFLIYKDNSWVWVSSEDYFPVS